MLKNILKNKNEVILKKKQKSIVSYNFYEQKVTRLTLKAKYINQSNPCVMFTEYRIKAKQYRKFYYNTVQFISLYISQPK